MALPAYGTAQIKCAKRGCKWTGTERERKDAPHPTLKSATRSVCPLCGDDGYYFIKEKKK